MNVISCMYMIGNDTNYYCYDKQNYFCIFNFRACLNLSRFE